MNYLCFEEESCSVPNQVVRRDTEIWGLSFSQITGEKGLPSWMRPGTTGGVLIYPILVSSPSHGASVLVASSSSSILFKFLVSVVLHAMNSEE